MTTTQTESSTVQRGAGPLTTVFTTPDFCESLYWQNTVTPPLSSSVCMPPRFHELWDYSWGYYSPGICPSGYSKGCSFPTTLASTSAGNVYFGGSVVAGETVQVCCPTGYTCLTNTVSSYSKCVATDATDLVFGIQVRWKESDLSILETDPTVAGSTYSSPATATASTTQSDASSSGSSGSVAAETSKTTSNENSATSTGVSGSATSGHLTSSATIGIAVGAMGFAFILSALAFFLWRCKRRRRGETSGTRLSSSISLEKVTPGFVDKAELDSNMVAPLSPNPSELGGEREVAEMAVPHFVAELPGSLPVGYQERRASAEWPVSPVDTSTLPSESVAEPSPLSETSGSRRKRLSFRKSFKETPILPRPASSEGQFPYPDESGPLRRRSTLRESSTLPQHLSPQHRNS